jgi:hypothetical protein
MRNLGFLFKEEKDGLGIDPDSIYWLNIEISNIDNWSEMQTHN